MTTIRTARSATLLFGVLLCTGQVHAPPEPRAIEIDSVRVLADLEYLSSPALQGRAVGTPGGEAARTYIEAELRAAGVRAFERGWLQPFTVREFAGGPPIQAVNVVGYVPGTVLSDRYIVVTAHYDHLGVHDGAVFAGADDNASGVAGLLEIARHFAASPPRHSIIFAALDAEEMSLRGAREFVRSPPVPLDAILLNVNLDMISRNEAGELYAAGTYHYPALTPLVEAVAERSELTVLRGHDRPDRPGQDDWTMLSDHGAFHERGIPFLYFGVEDHPDYHTPRDIFQNIDPAFFVAAVRTAADFVAEADQRLR